MNTQLGPQGSIFSQFYYFYAVFSHWRLFRYRTDQEKNNLVWGTHFQMTHVFTKCDERKEGEQRKENKLEEQCSPSTALLVPLFHIYNVKSPWEASRSVLPRWAHPSKQHIACSRSRCSVESWLDVCYKPVPPQLSVWWHINHIRFLSIRSHLWKRRITVSELQVIRAHKCT